MTVGSISFGIYQILKSYDDGNCQPIQSGVIMAQRHLPPAAPAGQAIGGRTAVPPATTAPPPPPTAATAEVTRIQAAFRGYATRRITRLALQQFARDCAEIEAFIADEDPLYSYRRGHGLSPHLGYGAFPSTTKHHYHHLSQPFPLLCHYFFPAWTCGATAPSFPWRTGTTVIWKCTRPGPCRCKQRNVPRTTRQ